MVVQLFCLVETYILYGSKAILFSRDLHTYCMVVQLLCLVETYILYGSKAILFSRDLHTYCMVVQLFCLIETYRCNSSLCSDRCSSSYSLSD